MSTTVTPRRRGRRRQQTLERVLGTPALFATAYGNVGSSIYYALGARRRNRARADAVVFLVSGLIFAATAATYAEGTVRYPRGGRLLELARHAFNELVSFGAAWAQMLNYIITIAISAFFVPHYLSIFWSPLRENPWDIVGGAVWVAAKLLFQELLAMNIAHPHVHHALRPQRPRLGARRRHQPLVPAEKLLQNVEAPREAQSTETNTAKKHWFNGFWDGLHGKEFLASRGCGTVDAAGCAVRCGFALLRRTKTG